MARYLKVLQQLFGHHGAESFPILDVHGSPLGEEVLPCVCTAQVSRPRWLLPSERAGRALV